MPIDLYAQVTDINGPQLIYLSDSLYTLIRMAYPQKFAEFVTVISGANRLGVPSYVYRGVKRPLLEDVPGGPHLTDGKNIVALSCGINWIPRYNNEVNAVDIFPSSGKVFFALVKLVQDSRYHGELRWWGYWPEDRNRPGAPDDHANRFESQIWQVQHQ
ncbi:MAG: hypothetical protein HY854_14300 [Burkholderiales bacterium]|nr:hypothetical protein [Burkholderiales bacterium]